MVILDKLVNSYTKMKAVLWMLQLVFTSLSHASQVRIFPTEVVTTTGGNSIFMCTLVQATDPSQEISSIQWLFNGSAALTNETIELGNAMTQLNDGLGRLTITSIPLDFNQTRVICDASLSTGERVTSTSATLLVQGLLDEVKSLRATLQNSTISLTWTAPFTLDILNTDPDIEGYCVDVVNSTSSSTLHSECGITETEYEYPINGGCNDHMMIVTPLNVVGNGTSASILYSQIVSSPQIIEVFSGYILPNTNIVIYNITMSTPVCNSRITAIDINTDESIAFLNSDLTIMFTDVSFTSEKLRLNRKYRIMVNASNVNGSFISSYTISLHDIVETGIHMNPLRIHTQYLLDSQAAGGLFSFLFIDANGVIDFRKSTYLCLEKYSSQSYVLPFTQSPELYVISAYDIEEDGLLYSGEAYPATTSTHVISGPGHSTSSEIEDCDVISDGQVVCVQCSFPPNSTSLGFLVVVQRDSISKARTLLINSTQPGQALGPVTVEVEEGGVYQVTVFAIRGEVGIVGSAVEYTTQIEILADEYSSTQIAAEDNKEATGSAADLNTPEVHNLTVSTAIIGVGVGLVVLAMMIAIPGVVIPLTMLCHRIRTSRKLRMKITSEVEELQVSTNPTEVDVSNVNITVQDSIMYEEIGDVKDSFNYSQNVLYGLGPQSTLSSQDVSI